MPKPNPKAAGAAIAVATGALAGVAVHTEAVAAAPGAPAAAAGTPLGIGAVGAAGLAFRGALIGCPALARLRLRTRLEAAPLEFLTRARAAFCCAVRNRRPLTLLAWLKFGEWGKWDAVGSCV
ncbi:MAG: hypothetical protein AAGL08_13920 [Cyanobacteria bacterium J06573_11]